MSTPTNDSASAAPEATRDQDAPGTTVSTTDAPADLVAADAPAPAVPAQAAVVPHQPTGHVLPTAAATPATAGPRTQVVLQTKQRGLFVRALWYLFIGWWLSGWAMLAAGICIVSVVLLPAGLAIVNRLPQILTLRPKSTEIKHTVHADGSDVYRVGDAEQRGLAIRAVYFVLVGWWVGLTVMAVAWLLSVLIVTLPVGLMLLNRLPAIITLRRN